MTDATDEELTKLAALALGYKHLGPVGVLLAEDERRGSVADAKYPGKLWCLSGSNDWWESPEGHAICGPCQMHFDPLHNDEHAMALVKKLKLTIGYSDGWSVIAPHCQSFHYPDLNRAIVESVTRKFAAGDRQESK